MPRRFRRLWLVSVTVLFLIPLVIGQLVPTSMTSADELRTLAPMPADPTKAADWLALPAKIDAYLRDHFGLRHAMTHAYAKVVHQWLDSGDDSVMVGRDGWLFFRGADLVQQSSGRLMREQGVIETAETIAQARAVLTARGVKLIFASPPNSASVYPDKLPRWVGGVRRPTEYDLMLRALAARGVPTVDLRAVLARARKDGRVYFKHDTHWTARGGIAGFNAVAAAMGHDSWQIDPATALAPPALIAGGDLARMLGLTDDLHETTQYLALPDYPRQDFVPGQFYTYETTSGHTTAPTILIIGDSFAEKWFSPLVLAHAGHMVLTHIQNCDFNWSWIDRFKPDEVWWMPTERAFLCAPGLRPRGMPSTVAHN